MIRLETPLPPSLEAGSASAMYLAGTAMDGAQPVRALTLLIDGQPHEVSRIGMPRFDVPERRGGFWTTVGVRAPAGATEVVLEAQAHGRDGLGERIELARIPVRPREQIAVERGNQGVEHDTIAICMATHQPDVSLLRAQIDSIRAQTDTDWVCVISDDCSDPERYRQILQIVDGDTRFSISRASERLGFYRNFERALTLAPPGAGLIALCDQDDVWHADKLAALRAALGPAMLVYSDQRLLDPEGRVLRETLWRGRRNNFTDIGSLLIANTVTGAASMFRREVVERALPFPDSPGNDFHDHWIALVALASGSLAYLDRPLYDYIQHGDAVFGDSRARTTGSRLIRAVRMRRWRAAYFCGYVPGEVRARTLLMRCDDLLSDAKRRALERYLASASSSTGLAWLVLRPLRMLARHTETLGSEWHLARGIVWLRLAEFVARRRWWPERLMLDTRLPSPEEFEQTRLRRWRENV